MSTTRADNETNLQALQDEMSDVRRVIEGIDDELVAPVVGERLDGPLHRHT